MKKALSVSTLVFSSLFLVACSTQPAAPVVKEDTTPKNTITLSKTKVSSNEDVSLTYATSGLTDKAWIGVIPSSTVHGNEATNDQYDVAYKYLSGSSAGTMTFTAPAQPGSYDFRLSDAGKELTSATFTVEAAAGADTKPGITLEKTTYAPGEAIKGEFKAPSTLDKNAWIGVIPSATTHGSEAENDKYDVSYQYMNGQIQGKIEMNAPTTAGSYDLRMNEGDSMKDAKELTTMTFTVK